MKALYRSWHLFVALLLAICASQGHAPLLPQASAYAIFPNQNTRDLLKQYDNDDFHDLTFLKGMSLLPFKSQLWPQVSRDGWFGAFRNNAWHNGIDFIVPLHTRIYPARAGIVVRAERYDPERNYGRGYGGLVVIEHIDGSQSWYAHLDQVAVHAGQVVTHDTFLGLSGGKNNGHSTGPHLHFMIVRKNGERINPQLAITGIDPRLN